MSICAHCGADAFFRCGWCEAEAYCSQEHQKLRWPEHQKFCSEHVGTRKAGDKEKTPVPAEYARRLAKLKKIARENAAKLKMPTPVNHPINYARLAEWVDKQGTPTLRKIAKVLAQNMMHVSFGQFYSDLQRTCAWVESAIKLMGENVAPVLLLPGGDGFYKSNTWVTMLALQGGFITSAKGVIYTMSEIEKMHKYAAEKEITIAVIALDDATFSGEQMLQNTSFRWSETTNDVLFIAVPYCGVAAQKLLTHGIEGKPKKQIKIPPHAIVLPAARELLKDAIEGAPEVEVRFAYYMFGITAGSTLLYFDHKMPDYLSTATRAFVFGETFGLDASTGRLERTGEYVFIEGCEHTLEQIPFGGDTEGWRKYANPCPKAFYKQIEYTRDGVAIPAVINDERRFNPRSVTNEVALRAKRIPRTAEEYDAENKKRAVERL